jgi:hypothetical protein
MNNQFELKQYCTWTSHYHIFTGILLQQTHEDLFFKTKICCLPESIPKVEPKCSFSFFRANYRFLQRNLTKRNENDGKLWLYIFFIPLSTTSHILLLWNTKVSAESENYKFWLVQLYWKEMYINEFKRPNSKCKLKCPKGPTPSSNEHKRPQSPNSLPWGSV